MPLKKRLSKKQLAVIDDLFSGEFDEQMALEKHKVSRNLYNRWLADTLFDTELSRRIASAHRQSQVLIARYASLAAAKLVQLTESDKEETARKACLDIITLPTLTANARRQPDPVEPEQDNTSEISPETAGKLLTALTQLEDK